MNSNWIYLYFKKFFEYQKSRVAKGEITATTIHNYYKVTKQDKNNNKDKDSNNKNKKKKKKKVDFSITYFIVLKDVVGEVVYFSR